MNDQASKTFIGQGSSASGVIGDFEAAREWFARIQSWPCGHAIWVEMPYSMQNQGAELKKRWGCEVVFYYQPIKDKIWCWTVVTASAKEMRMYVAEIVN